MARPMDDYVEVNVRIQAFYDKYADGSLQSEFYFKPDFAGKAWVVCKAWAYRNPEDPRPGTGTAWEQVPGKTNFTRDSELQNAETSAWGRAIAALGFEVKKGIATREDVERAQAASEAPGTKGSKPSSSPGASGAGQDANGAPHPGGTPAPLYSKPDAVIQAWLRSHNAETVEDLSDEDREKFLDWAGRNLD